MINADVTIREDCYTAHAFVFVLQYMSDLCRELDAQWAITDELSVPGRLSGFCDPASTVEVYINDELVQSYMNLASMVDGLRGTDLIWRIDEDITRPFVIKVMFRTIDFSYDSVDIKSWLDIIGGNE